MHGYESIYALGVYVDRRNKCHTSIIYCVSNQLQIEAGETLLDQYTCLLVSGRVHVILSTPCAVYYTMDGEGCMKIIAQRT